jgi:hypothetical protein
MDYFSYMLTSTQFLVIAVVCSAYITSYYYTRYKSDKMPSAHKTNGTNGVVVVNGSNVLNNSTVSDGINGTKKTNVMNGVTNGSNSIESRTLHIPDLFGGILSGDPVENPLESTIGPLSEEWTKAYVGPIGAEATIANI